MITKTDSHTKKGRNITRVHVTFGLATLLLFLSLIAATGQMGGLELAVFTWIYEMPDSLRGIALIVTQFGSIWILMAIVGLLLVVRKNPSLAVAVVRNTIITYILVEAMKFGVNRPRPIQLLTDITSREVVVFGNGFPSGHTAMATIIGLTLLPYIPRTSKWVVFVVIALVGWSRVYLGVHAPLDILGGFILASLVVILIEYLPKISQFYKKR